MFVQQARIAHDAFAFIPSQHVFHHEADETVAFRFHARHDFFAVHLHGIFVQMYAERVGVQRVVACFCGGNQQFGRHAADARASGAVGVVFNQVNILCMQQRIAECAHAGCASTNHDNICG